MAVKVNNVDVINNSRNLLVNNGTVTAPSITNSSDTNTGMYFPSSDTISITTGGTLAATFAANGDFTAVGNVTAYSDVRLKKDLQVIENALSKVKSLTGYTYTRIDTEERHTGVIAQDVQKVLPEAIINDNNYLSVAYGNMVGLLIEAIKELEVKVEELKARLEA